MVVSGEVYKQRISKINYCRTESKSNRIKNNGNTCVGIQGVFQTYHVNLHIKITIKLTFIVLSKR